MLEEITNFINSSGFPIFSFIVVVYGLKYSYDKSNEMFRSSLDKIGTLADAVNHNTEVLLTLVKEVEENENTN